MCAVSNTNQHLGKERPDGKTMSSNDVLMLWRQSSWLNITEALYIRTPQQSTPHSAARSNVLHCCLVLRRSCLPLLFVEFRHGLTKKLFAERMVYNLRGRLVLVHPLVFSSLRHAQNKLVFRFAVAPCGSLWLDKCCTLHPSGSEASLSGKHCDSIQFSVWRWPFYKFGATGKDKGTSELKCGMMA